MMSILLNPDDVGVNRWFTAIRKDRPDFQQTLKAVIKPTRSHVAYGNYGTHWSNEPNLKNVVPIKSRI